MPFVYLEIARELSEARFAARDEDDVVSVLREEVRELAAEACRRAGHERRAFLLLLVRHPRGVSERDAEAEPEAAAQGG